MEFELAQLEKALNAARSHANRLHKASDVHAMYKTVQRDVPAQVDSLAMHVSAQIDHVDESECAVVLTQSVVWHDQAPLLHEGRPLDLIHADGDKLWLGSCQHLQPGDEITQRRLVGSLPELFQAFESQWASLWNRHTDVPEGQWDQILEFAKSQLRPVHASPPSYDVETVQRTLRRKSKYAATSLELAGVICLPCLNVTWQCFAKSLRKQLRRGNGLSKFCMVMCARLPRLLTLLRLAISGP
jgi:hypothetical protein